MKKKNVEFSTKLAREKENSMKKSKRNAKGKQNLK
jgi:hypothetical protein